MTNKEKLEIIDKKLDELYNELQKEHTPRDIRYITQSINNIEVIKINVLLDYEKEKKEEEENKKTLITPSTTYICPKCKKEVIVYGKFLSGMCYDCNHKLVKKK